MTIRPVRVPPSQEDEVYRATRQEVERRQPPPPDPSSTVVIHRGR